MFDEEPERILDLFLFVATVFCCILACVMALFSLYGTPVTPWFEITAWLVTVVAMGLNAFRIAIHLSRT